MINARERFNARSLTLGILNAFYLHADRDEQLYQQLSFETHFRKPYTVVFATFENDGDTIFGVGCSKVCHPDTWDESAGQQLAVSRAARDIANQVFES